MTASTTDDGERGGSKRRPAARRQSSGPPSSLPSSSPPSNVGAVDAQMPEGGSAVHAIDPSLRTTSVRPISGRSAKRPVGRRSTSSAPPLAVNEPSPSKREDDVFASPSAIDRRDADRRGANPRDPDPRDADPLQALEAGVDRLIAEAGSVAGDPQARRRAAEALTELASALGASQEGGPKLGTPRTSNLEGRDLDGVSDERRLDESVLGSARELLSSDYYFRRWGRIAMRNRSEQVDEFGLDPTYEARISPLLTKLYRSWFRVEARNVERVPSTGRALIVANHGGALPWDGLMVRTALKLEHRSARDARWLAEDFSFHMPFLGAMLTRLGAVRACPENAERLLAGERVVTVFPEGIKGVGKLYRDRYRLQRFGRGGYVKVALRTGTPIIPVGIVGAEEAYPLLFESPRAARMVGWPFLPITPLFPWLGPAGLVPLPSRWVMVFGEPIDLSEHGPDAASDTLLVHRLNDQIRSSVEKLVSEALAARENTWR